VCRQSIRIDYELFDFDFSAALQCGHAGERFVSTVAVEFQVGRDNTNFMLEGFHGKF